MTQDERREYLIQYLLKEEVRFVRQSIPTDKQGQENLLRSLMNIRPPRPVSGEFLKIQDEYLTERNRERGITDIDTLAPVKSDSRLYIWQGDITTLKCDAIVNACNSQMLGCFSPMHACIDNFIHTYAGVELRLKMHEIMTKQGHEEETGKAKITSGYNLPAKYIFKSSSLNTLKITILILLSLSRYCFTVFVAISAARCCGKRNTPVDKQ